MRVLRPHPSLHRRADAWAGEGRVAFASLYAWAQQRASLVIRDQETTASKIRAFSKSGKLGGGHNRNAAWHRAAGLFTGDWSRAAAEANAAREAAHTGRPPLGSSVTSGLVPVVLRLARPVRLDPDVGGLLGVRRDRFTPSFSRCSRATFSSRCFGSTYTLSYRSVWLNS